MREMSFSAEMGNASPISGFVMGLPSAKAVMNPRRRVVSICNFGRDMCPNLFFLTPFFFFNLSIVVLHLNIFSVLIFNVLISIGCKVI